jgi:hypothetical protein
VSWKIPICYASKPFSTWIRKVLKSLCEVRDWKVAVYTPLENSVLWVSRAAFRLSHFLLFP